MPESRNRAVNQPRVKLRQGVIPQSPFGHVAGTERLDQHISLAGELDGLLAAFRSAEIQHNAFLPAVPRDPGRLKTERISAGRFHLYHFGPVIGHYQGADGPRHPQGEIQDG